MGFYKFVTESCRDGARTLFMQELIGWETTNLNPQLMRSRILNSSMIRILGTIFAGLLGLAFGSFLNVCLSRWPEGESIVRPRSHCRQCNRTLAWWENVPLVSWLALRGRCRTCRAWIGWRYPLVELVLGVLWAVWAWQSLGGLLDANSTASDLIFCSVFVPGVMIFFWLLVALAVLDFENHWLPDWITVPGIALGFTFRLFIIMSTALGSATDAYENVRYGAFGAALQRLLAILAAAALILLIRWLYWLIRRREGIGLGDAKLMALLAAWLGLPRALLAFGLSVVLGTLVAVVLRLLPSAQRDSESWWLSKFPLGTFLCIGGIVSSLWGQPILSAYLRWAGF
jgi:leader peptidase (prepilin peptidase)/N-methyltransferase